MAKHPDRDLLMEQLAHWKEMMEHSIQKGRPERAETYRQYQADIAKDIAKHEGRYPRW